MGQKYPDDENVKSIVNIAVNADDCYPLCKRKTRSSHAASRIGAGVAIKQLKRNLRYLRNRVNIYSGDADIESIPQESQLREHLRLVEVAKQLLIYFTNNSSLGIKVLNQLPNEHTKKIHKLFETMRGRLKDITKQMNDARKIVREGGAINIDNLLEDVAARLVQVQVLIDETDDELKKLDKLMGSQWRESVKDIWDDPVCLNPKLS